MGNVGGRGGGSITPLRMKGGAGTPPPAICVFQPSGRTLRAQADPLIGRVRFYWGKSLQGWRAGDRFNRRDVIRSTCGFSSICKTARWGKERQGSHTGASVRGKKKLSCEIKQNPSRRSENQPKKLYPGGQTKFLIYEPSLKLSDNICSTDARAGGRGKQMGKRVRSWVTD